MKTSGTVTALIAALALAGFTGTVTAETRITYKSAKASSSYYQMAVQLAEAVKRGSDGRIIVTVEESQGSVQNVKEAPRRGPGYVFTTPPGLVKLALNGARMFSDKNPGYQEIRALFPIPSLTMHYVVAADSGIRSFDDLAGKDFIIGKGSFGATEAKKNLAAFGLEGKVNLLDVELGSAVPALKNGKVHGFATAGSYPAPNVIEAAAGGGIRLLSMSDEQVALTKRSRLVIPAGTYPGVDTDTVTTTLEVGAYANSSMDDDTAYALVKTFWAQKDAMKTQAAWWGPVRPEAVTGLGAKLHPGALRWYREAGIAIPAELQ